MRRNSIQKLTAFTAATATLLAVVACGKSGLPGPTNTIQGSAAPWESIRTWEDGSSGFLSREAVVEGLRQLQANPPAEDSSPLAFPVMATEAIDSTSSLAFDEKIDAKLMGFIAKPNKGGYTTRPSDTPVKNQLNRGWCTAFGTTAVLENMLNQKYNKVLDLSEMSLFDQYQHFYTDMAVSSATTKKALVEESVLPYSTKYTEDENCEGQYTTKLCKTPIALPDDKRIAKGTTSTKLKTQTEVLKALESGHALVMDAVVNSSWKNPKNGLLSNTGSILGGHAFALVGYEMDDKAPGGGYFVIKNSWGPQWGDKGYGYLPFSYCKQYRGCNFYEIMDVTLAGANPVDPAKPTATPGAKPTNGPTAAPTAAPAGSVVVKVELDGKAEDGGQVFHLRLDGTAEQLGSIKRVVYGIHPAFRDMFMSVVSTSPAALADKFSSDKYETFADKWTTAGTKIEFKDGHVEMRPGIEIIWTK